MMGNSPLYTVNMIGQLVNNNKNCIVLLMGQTLDRWGKLNRILGEGMQSQREAMDLLLEMMC